MPDPYYPTTDIKFIIENVIASGKLVPDGIIKFGFTTTFVVRGPQAVYRRSTLIREIEPGQICYEQATALASKFLFMRALLEWMVINRNWKEGAYILPEVIQLK